MVGFTSSEILSYSLLQGSDFINLQSVPFGYKMLWQMTISNKGLFCDSLGLFFLSSCLLDFDLDHQTICIWLISLLHCSLDLNKFTFHKR